MSSGRSSTAVLLALVAIGLVALGLATFGHRAPVAPSRPAPTASAPTEPSRLGPEAEVAPSAPVESREPAAPTLQPVEYRRLVQLSSLPPDRRDELQKMGNVLKNAGLPDLPDGRIDPDELARLLTTFGKLGDEAMSSHREYTSACFAYSDRAKKVIAECLESGLQPPYDVADSDNLRAQGDDERVVFHSTGDAKKAMYRIAIPKDVWGRLDEDRRQKIAAITEFVDSTVRSHIVP